MQEIPELWRTETYHVVTVHLPIVLLIFGSIFYWLGFNTKLRYLHPSGRILLYVGVISAWLAVFTGNQADGIVARKICDPTILKDHQNLAVLLSYLFSGAVVLDLLQFVQINQLLHKIRLGLILILMISGSILLMYASHLGGKLVYLQGAGVYHPTEDCVEFE